MQPARVRQSNQRAILTVVSTQPGVSNAGIARRTGLAPQTVSAVLSDLEGAGLLKRGDARRDGGRGQPATPIFIDPEGAFALGAEIGCKRIEVVLTDLDARVVRRERRVYDYPDPSVVFDLLGELVATVTAPMTQALRSRIVGLGLAVPSALGDASSLLGLPVQPDLLAATRLATEAARVTGIADVHVANDGNAACWAEFVAHSSPRPGNFALVLVDCVLGAGLIAEDRLLEGATGAAASLGSMRVTGRDGKLRYADEIASLTALGRALEEAGLTLAEALGPNPGPAAGAVLGQWIEEAAFALAQVALNTAAVMEFDFVVVEGEVPEPVLRRLVEAVRQSLGELPSPSTDRPHVRMGHLHRSGAAQGAAFLRMYHRFFSRELADLET